jgi:hypothetical protein
LGEIFYFIPLEILLDEPYDERGTLDLASLQLHPFEKSYIEAGGLIQPAVVTRRMP